MLDVLQAKEIQSATSVYNQDNEMRDHDAYNNNMLVTAGTSAHSRPGTSSIPHDQHNNSKPKAPERSGHSHANLNMRGVFLHVVGDALGNVGVIATALFIWLTPEILR
jgi:solute carrier family 30 (zinc transporter), member 1